MPRVLVQFPETLLVAIDEERKRSPGPLRSRAFMVRTLVGEAIALRIKNRSEGSTAPPRFDLAAQIERMGADSLLPPDKSERAEKPKPAEGIVWPERRS